MRVELLYFEDCPNYARFLPRLREQLRKAGVTVNVELRRVESSDAALEERFLGSPSLRIDGRDVEPDAADRTDFGLKCRLYRTSGGLQGTPPDRLVLLALAEASRAGHADGDRDA